MASQTPLHLKELYMEALSLHYWGYWEQAKANYEALLEWDANDGSAWQGLGLIEYELNQNYQALESFSQALKVQKTGENYYYLGLVLERLGDFSEALAAYETALVLEFDSVKIYHQLGNIYIELGQINRAINYYQQAIQSPAYYLPSYLALGQVLVSKNQLNNALNLYQMALEHYPDYPDILEQLSSTFYLAREVDLGGYYQGIAAYYRGEYQRAISHLTTSLSQEKTLELYEKLADAYQQLGEIESCFKIYSEAIANYPNSFYLYLAYLDSLQNAGQIQKALELNKVAQKKFPELLYFQWLSWQLLPIIYETPEEIIIHRQRFGAGLITTLKTLSLRTEIQKQQALEALNLTANFYLQYQGYNDLEYQQKYGKLVSKIMRANYPQWVKPRLLPPRSPTGKIKIGYISSGFQWHTVGTVFLGWIKYANLDQFEIFCYALNRETDEKTHLFQLYSHHFQQFDTDLETICQTIIQDELHILVFLDIGMNPLITQLAGLKLAPIQMAGWGHPVTSGSPQIDYFISGDLQEPADGQSHYSEQLIRLPNLGICYSKPPLPTLEKTRSDWGINLDEIVYLSCQSLFKYLPQYDQIFLNIIRQVPSAKIVFISHWNSGVTEKFRTRLTRVFAQEKRQFSDHCLLLPRQTYPDYLQLIQIADIGLDTIGFTGFMTTLEMVAAGLPVVTCAGTLMRSRQSAAILWRIGISETIAQTPDDYLKIAIRLGLEPNWRLEIKQFIQQNQDQLYEDHACLQTLEKFYHQVVSFPHNRTDKTR